MTSGSYAVSGRVVERTMPPRFQAIVSVRKGQRPCIGLVEWVDTHRKLTPEHIHFMMATALLAWSIRQGQEC